MGGADVLDGPRDLAAMGFAAALGFDAEACECERVLGQIVQSQRGDNPHAVILVPAARSAWARQLAADDWRAEGCPASVG